MRNNSINGDRRVVLIAVGGVVDGIGPKCRTRGQSPVVGDYYKKDDVSSRIITVRKRPCTQLIKTTGSVVFNFAPHNSSRVIIIKMMFNKFAVSV